MTCWARIVGVCAVALAVAGCGRPTPTPPVLRATVANSYLESAVRDLFGDRVTVVRLAQPRFCPGHYDMEQRTVRAAQATPLFLRFDTEAELDVKLGANTNQAQRVVAIDAPVNPGLAADYNRVCRDVAAAGLAAGWWTAAAAENRLAAVTRAAEAAADKLRRQVMEGNWARAPVVTAVEHADWCAWLGLRVVGTFRAEDAGDEAALNRLVERARAAGARLVVGDHGASRPVANWLAEQLGVKPVLLAVTPPVLERPPSYAEMLAVNGTALLRAGR